MSNNIDKYAKVKLGGGNEFMGKGPLIFMSEVDFGGRALVALPCTPNSGRYTFFTSFRILRHHVAWHGPSPTQNDANRLHHFRKDTNNLKATPNYRQPSYRPCT